jgi:hypothetical protein
MAPALSPSLINFNGDSEAAGLLGFPDFTEAAPPQQLH